MTFHDQLIDISTTMLENLSLSNIFFTSDIHFDHANIIKYSNRPFTSIEEMNNVILDNINNLVGEDDILYNLGDFVFGYDKVSKARGFRDKIRCKNIIYIKGNHDPKPEHDDELRKIFSEVHYLTEKVIQGKAITLCHYAMKLWNNSHRGTWCLYGHSHGGLMDDLNSFSMDVGVDTVARNGYDEGQQSYRPYTLSEIQDFMSRKTWRPLDHHNASTN